MLQHKLKILNEKTFIQTSNIKTIKISTFLPYLFVHYMFGVLYYSQNIFYTAFSS